MNTTSIDMANRTEAHIGRNIDATLHKHSSSQTHPNYHVLVVEDNIINQRVLCNQLKKSGCTIQVANHGGEALIELLKTTYSKEPTVSPPFNLSVVLMDIEVRTSNITFSFIEQVLTSPLDRCPSWTV